MKILHTEDRGEGCQLIRVRGALAEWTLERWGDDDPHFPSIPMALMLGLSRARTLNELILRLWPTETELSHHGGAKVPSDGNSDFRGTVPRKSPSDGEVYYRFLPSTGGRRQKEYLLTRRQALKVIMRSETENADALQDEMIEILLAVLRGDPTAQALEGLRRQVQRLETAVRTRPANDDPPSNPTERDRWFKEMAADLERRSRESIEASKREDAARSRRWARDRRAVRTLQDPAERQRLLIASPEGLQALRARYGPDLPPHLSTRQGALLHGRYDGAFHFAPAMRKAGYQPIGRWGRTCHLSWRRADCEALRQQDLLSEE